MHFSAEKLLSILGVMTSGLMVGRGQVSDPSHLFLTNSLFLFMVIQLPCLFMVIQLPCLLS